MRLASPPEHLSASVRLSPGRRAPVPADAPFRRAVLEPPFRALSQPASRLCGGRRLARRLVLTDGPETFISVDEK